jgi:hypothetical protein
MSVSEVFPDMFTQTIRELAQAPGTVSPSARQPAEPAGDTQAVIADCGARLARLGLRITYDPDNPKSGPKSPSAGPATW